MAIIRTIIGDVPIGRYYRTDDGHVNRRIGMSQSLDERGSGWSHDPLETVTLLDIVDHAAEAPEVRADVELAAADILPVEAPVVMPVVIQAPPPPPEPTPEPVAPPPPAPPVAEPAPAVVHHHRFISTWVAKLLGMSTIIVVLFALGLMGIASFYGYQIVKRQDKTDEQMAIVLSNLQVLYEQSTIRDIVEQKLPKETPETRARVAFEIYDFCRRNNVRAWLLFGIIEKESGWDTKAVSSAGARGLMQLMPGTAITQAKAQGITLTSLDQVFDPVINIRLGEGVLMDNYRGAVMAGKSPEGDFTRALWSYNGGGESYARLVMEKVVPYKARLESPLKGKMPIPAVTE